MTKQGGAEDTGKPAETRYFIGVTPEGYRLSMVSEAVKREWDGPAEDDDYEIGAGCDRECCNPR